ncbi:KIF9 protein, partial [Menura novaehollandiae]|nr:KIF9 protein [Menura novaehollandiae]
LLRVAKRVQAFVRVKPTAHFAQEMIKFGPDNKSINIYIKKDARGGFVNNTQTGWSFRLDGLLHNTSQELVYDTVARDLVAKALLGYNGTIMCYGQTGAGKTFTMTGATCEYRHRGIIPRALQQIFKAAAEFLNVLVTVRISYLEIYNEALFDLLSPGLGRGIRDTQLVILDSPQGVYVKGLSIHPPQFHELSLGFSLPWQGETNRVIAEHTLNKNSSRSHCIFTIYIECRSRDYTNLKCLKSKITLIDLAGSERLGKTGSEGQLRVEASYINKSLTFLEQLIIALADPRREHIPFRQSKLTHVLKDSLGGCCNTVLVTNVCGEAAHVDETLSSLRFATRMKWVTTEPVPNEPFYREVSVKALEDEITLLKRELLMQDCLVRIRYPSVHQVGCLGMRPQVAGGFLWESGSGRDHGCCGVAGVSEGLSVLSQQEEAVEDRLRSKYILRARDELGAGSDTEPGSASASESSSDLDSEEEEQEEEEQEEKVMPAAWPGPEKERTGSPLADTGLDDSSPEKSPTKDLDAEEDGGEEDIADSDEEPSGPSSGEDSQQDRAPPSKPEAFELFKREAGREIHRIFRDNKSILLARKKRSNSVARRINLKKREMEGIKEALEAQKRKRKQEGEYMDEKGQVIIDEKEFALILKLKELKEEHRAGFAELQDLKAEIQYCQQLVDKCRKRLISEFEIWYNESFLIPGHVQEALKPGGNIRPGMIPINRVMCLEEDEQDKFERMQETALPECPGSVSFYRARMQTEQKHTFNRTMASLRNMHRKPGLVKAAGKNKSLSFLNIT